jgi:dienelactone hydrolase
LLVVAEIGVKAGDLKPAQPGAGKECKIAGADVYCVGSGEKAIIISTDIFSWRFPNIRAIADQYAAAGYSVYIARTINEGDVPSGDMGAWMAKFGEWLERNPVERATDIVRSVAKELSQKHAKIAVLGFCYGGQACGSQLFLSRAATLLYFVAEPVVVFAAVQ